MALLGDDGLGYELARKLESHGVWLSWLGDALYSTFIHFLSSPAAWHVFMRSSADDSNTNNKPPQIQLHLQLRVRALLFDKAAVSLYTPSPFASSNISNLNPNHLELHGEDVYFTLETGGQDADQHRPGLATSNTISSKGHSKTSSNAGELPETWYTQFFEKYRASKTYRLMFSDRESEKRTPEQMSTYLRVLENHKRKRVVFKENLSNQRPNLLADDSDVVDDKLFFPETMFTVNCVPDGAVLQTSEPANNQKMQLNGVLDDLPQLMTKSPVISPIMIERLGIRPEYLNMEQQRHQARGKDGEFEGKRKLIGQEQAAQMSKKVVVHLLTNVGFESSSVAATEILAQFLTCHINKLGGRLKLFSDSYRKQCSAIELLKMFLQTSGYRNLRPLEEHAKGNTRNIIVQQTQQVQGIQAQLQQPTLQHSQQNLIRQMSPLMQQQQQMNNPQYVAFQQQQHLERMRRLQQQQSVTPRPAGMNSNIMNMDKDNRPLAQVKMENPEMPLDANTFTAMNSRHPHLQQLRQQQLAAISSLHAQANNPFRQMNSLQLQQIQSVNMGVGRAQPVKVEGFQELMGGDSLMKHDSDDNKLLSPPK